MTYMSRLLDRFVEFKNQKKPESLRPMFEYIKNNMHSDSLTGVEIGTRYGYNALSMLSNLPIKKLYLVDPYEAYDGYDEWHNSEFWRKQDMNEIHQGAKQKLQGFEDRAVFVRKKSVDAVDDVPDGLDFVYIDGNHAYDYVKEDMLCWYPKIRNGGVLGGHDLQHQGVTHALVEFMCDKKDFFIGAYDCHPDWWMIKNKLKSDGK